MGYIKLAISSLAALVLMGCAHSINVEPDIGKIGTSSKNRISKTVGYHVPPEVANIEITTPGGGGDNVRYKPYAAMSPGFERMLSNVFETIIPVPSLTELPKTTSSPVEYVAVPTLITNSGGSNFFTWPPENFTVDLTASIHDKEGKIVASPRVVGVGRASTSQRLGDHGFSGRRAFEDALQKMEVALRDWGSGLASESSGTAAAIPQVANRLAQLEELFARKVISEHEYEAKRKAILDEF